MGGVYFQILRIRWVVGVVGGVFSDFGASRSGGVVGGVFSDFRAPGGGSGGWSIFRF